MKLIFVHLHPLSLNYWPLSFVVFPLSFFTGLSRVLVSQANVSWLEFFFNVFFIYLKLWFFLCPLFLKKINLFIPISYCVQWVSQVNPSWLWFFSLMFHLIFFFQIHHLTLHFWALSFFFYIGLSWSHIPGRMLVKLSGLTYVIIICTLFVYIRKIDMVYGAA